MAKIDLSKISEPISEEQPCGPDLDMEFDMDFMNLMAEIEGALPTSYFRFDPGSFGFDGYYNRLGDQLERTHDLRLLVPLAKLRILQGDLAGCAAAIAAMRDLLTSFWADAHPQPMDGDYVLRTSQLMTLDDNPNMVLPLQHTTIVRSRRSGAITLRKWQVAKGEVSAREGEDALDAATITAALAEADKAEIEKVAASLETIRGALATIQTTVIAEAGYENAVALDRLPKSVDAMLELIRETTGVGAAPAGAEAGEEGADSGGAAGTGTVLGTVVLPPGAVTSRKEVKQALDAAHRYFLVNEPSSPAQLLLREAIGLVDKGFYAAIYDMIPSQASYSVLRVGRDPFFELSLPEVDGRNPAPEIPSDEAESESWAETGLGDDDEVSGDPEAGETVTGEETAGDEAAAEETVEEAATGKETTPEEPGWEETTAETAVEEEPEAEEEAGEVADAGLRFWANTRPEAVALMQKVISYYKVAEPTSPVPLLLERAIQLSSMSFMELLSDVLPAGTLGRPESGT
jgi:type VI secretion system protein ImpA